MKTKPQCYWCEKTGDQFVKDKFQDKGILRCSWCPQGKKIEKFMKLIDKGRLEGKIL